jgi:hypothetical protein
MRTILTVVPAKAGTHNHQRSLLLKISAHTAQIERLRRMGPCVRRDDVWGDLRENTA